MELPAWRALSTAAQALYPWLRLEWHGAEYNNNGSIRLSVRQAADRLGVGRAAAARAFHDLQAKGWIVVVEPASLGVEGEARAPAYELTEIALPHAGNTGPRRLYRTWSTGNDFTVVRSPANNPTGRNGKSRHRNRDGPVPKTMTKTSTLSSKR
ncbi:hypothetical protein [Wenxinia marina]|uniref:hypothetical protein n=1 Tax=Wenxinia marina TaxID=390641 RepID=UPI0019C88DB2|nr:hypothetical protein [Wenxinia marina]GGL58449.1 hypothetical protein GCM10011392_11110 [Wenxinia marina]